MNTFIVLISLISGSLGIYLVFLAHRPEQSFAESARVLVRRQAVKTRDYSEIGKRLGLLKRATNFLDFRTEQMINTASIFIISFVFLTLVTQSLFLALFLSIVIAGLTFILIDRSLTQAISKSRTLLEAEFPAVVEIMTLSLSAGETPAQAMYRISERSQGLLAAEFRTAVDQIRNGVPFHAALDELGRRIDSIVIRRFVDAMVNAVVRGAPLVEVLQRHAVEARQSHKNAIMAKAGKAEISMMIPVVFLILPISILFALWPSLSTLNIFST